MDERMQSQTKQWTHRDCHDFYKRYFNRPFEEQIGDLPFSSDQMLGMRADSYRRGYRSGYLRFVPSLKVAELDAVYKLQHAAVRRSDTAFREVATRGPGWACFMPAPVKNDASITTLSQLTKVLNGVADGYALPSGQVTLPNLAELMYLFMMEVIYDEAWPHARVITAISSTVIEGQRLGLSVVTDGRMRMGLTFMPADGPFEGDVLPIAYSASPTT